MAILRDEKYISLVAHSKIIPCRHPRKLFSLLFNNFFSLNYIYWSTNRKSMGCPKVSYGLSARNYQICAIFCQFLPILLLPWHRNCKYLGLNFKKLAKFTEIISSNIMLKKIYEKKLGVI